MEFKKMDLAQDSPELSIIVTCYNIEKYVEQCLDSVVNQTLKNIEIIVVDDGSTDGTPDIIKRYAADDNRIIPILLAENSIGGVATAANKGLDRANGKYIGFADGDDYCELDMFEKLVSAAEAEDADLAMCKYLLFDEADQSSNEPAEIMRWSGISSLTSIDLTSTENTKALLRFIAVPWRKVYRRSLIEGNRIRFPVVDYFWEDNPFHWQSVISASKITLIPEVLCYHRVNRAGQTMATVDSSLLNMFGHFSTISDWLDQSGNFEKYGVQLLNWGISQFEWIQKRIPTDSYEDLFAALSRMVVMYSKEDITSALDEKGKNTHMAIGFVEKNDKESFIAHLINVNSRNSVQPLSLTKNSSGSMQSLFKTGLVHLKDHGFRSTAKKMLDYARLRTSNSFLRPKARIGTNSGADVETLIALLLVAKNDMVKSVTNEMRVRFDNLEEENKIIRKELKILNELLQQHSDNEV